MTWNFHNYYTNSTNGLISKLKLSDERKSALKALRKRVRDRTTEVFKEAKELAQTKNIAMLSLESFKFELSKTKLKHLPPEAQEEVIQLIKGMDDRAKKAFLSLTPRFWTQGSFQYDTLNNPYATPPQEMDIDDGTYLPMAIFENKPVIGHRLLLLLVDSSLQSLVYENYGWEFEAKRTCARIKIPDMHTHIDVPMYAIPEDQFLRKQTAAATLESLSVEGTMAYDSRADYRLDSDCVNLALREGEERWTKSDPKIVEDWFKGCCLRIGGHLRDISRFLKSWRDVQWENGGGPSSISLMAAIVSILDRVPHNKNDLGATMKLIADNLPAEFASGVESPDHTDEKPLFPPARQHGEREQDIMRKLEALREILVKAEKAETKELALRSMNLAFGQRVTDCELIIRESSAPAFIVAPDIGSKPKKISDSMISG